MNFMCLWKGHDITYIKSQRPSSSKTIITYICQRCDKPLKSTSSKMEEYDPNG